MIPGDLRAQLEWEAKRVLGPTARIIFVPPHLNRESGEVEACTSSAGVSARGENPLEASKHLLELLRSFTILKRNQEVRCRGGW
jgi:hypothetical protein